MCIYWQPSSVVFNQKIKKEVAVNLQSFQEGLKGSILKC